MRRWDWKQTATTGWTASRPGWELQMGRLSVSWLWQVRWSGELIASGYVYDANPQIARRVAEGAAAVLAEAVDG